MTSATSVWPFFLQEEFSMLMTTPQHGIDIVLSPEMESRLQEHSENFDDVVVEGCFYCGNDDGLEGLTVQVDYDHANCVDICKSGGLINQS